MADEIVTESDTPPHTTIIERRGGSGAGLLIGFAILILAIIAAYFVLVQNRAEQTKSDAISSAAKSVGRAADKAGDAIDNATR